MSRLWHGALCSLALRRSIAGAGLWLALPFGIALALREWTPPAAMLGPLSQREIASALARQGVWASLLLFFAPLLLHRTAATIPRWRRGERDWLASSGAPRSALIGSAWSGAALAAAGLVAIAGVCAEAAAGASAPGLAYVGSLHAPAIVLLEAGEPVRWRAEAGPFARDRVYVARASFALVGGGDGGPSAEIRISATREGATASAQRVLSGRAAIELELPRGRGAVELAFERVGPGAVAVLVDPGVELFAPVSSVRRASLALAAIAGLTLVSTLALALGLGAWTSPWTATALTLCLCLPAWLAERGSFPWPWRALTDALEQVGEGFAPAWPRFATIAATIATAAIGFALALVQRDPWRRAT
jgi:hypothetical protein